MIDEWRLIRTAAPTAFISVADIRQSSRIDGTHDDGYIQLLIDAAISLLDGPHGMVGKAIAMQSWQCVRARAVGDEAIRLPIMPITSLVAIHYDDAEHLEQTAELSDYLLQFRGDAAVVAPVTSWPEMSTRPSALRITVSAGHDPVPATISQAAKMLVGHWYENREAASDVVMTPLPLGVSTLINAERVGWVRA